MAAAGRRRAGMSQACHTLLVPWTHQTYALSQRMLQSLQW